MYCRTSQNQKETQTTCPIQPGPSRGGAGQGCPRQQRCEAGRGVSVEPGSGPTSRHFPMRAPVWRYDGLLHSSSLRGPRRSSGQPIKGLLKHFCCCEREGRGCAPPPRRPPLSIPSGGCFASLTSMLTNGGCAEQKGQRTAAQSCRTLSRHSPGEALRLERAIPLQPPASLRHRTGAPLQRSHGGPQTAMSSRVGDTALDVVKPHTSVVVKPHFPLSAAARRRQVTLPPGSPRAAESLLTQECRSGRLTLASCTMAHTLRDAEADSTCAGRQRAASLCGPGPPARDQSAGSSRGAGLSQGGPGTPIPRRNKARPVPPLIFLSLGTKSALRPPRLPPLRLLGTGNHAKNGQSHTQTRLKTTLPCL
ncbi:hypothetical protein AAFF_G00347630 [Aldrovandia affinis]|uniref:Uncharacterized protein n=1 Tax=Aldrovandia affinis TaxID=143900 RepID=A0AAD7SJN7_9TELE|nr:hypothetical protein AAFF_G00347630 [Aldrovandia affinis]